MDEVFKNRLTELFNLKDVATTQEVASALYVVAQPNNRKVGIMSRVNKYNLRVEHIGYNAWVRV